MLVSPARNQSSSWTIDLRCSFLVVMSGKPGAEIEAHLMAEHRDRAGAGAVALLDAVGEHVFHQFEVLPHRSLSASATSKRPAERLAPRHRPGEAGPGRLYIVAKMKRGGTCRPFLHKLWPGRTRAFAVTR